MRIAIGSLMQESNAFCVTRAAIHDFRNKYLETGEAVIACLSGTNTEIGGAIGVLEAAGADIVPLLATHGGAGGIVTAECHRSLRDDLLARLEAAGPLDGVFLGLHGAMVAEDTDDVEGELLAAARRVTHGIPVAVSCDLHAHITPAMMAGCDILIGYQHYPHDDAAATAASAVRCLLEAIDGGFLPVMAIEKRAMLFAPHLEHTFGEGPMVELDRMARAVEGDAGPVRALSYFPVQPWLDLPDMGFAAVALAHADRDAAASAAGTLAREAWRRRAEFDVEMVPIDDAVRAALAVDDGPVVLADTSDCVGGGSTGDGAQLLEALVRLAPDVPSLVHIVDPDVAAEAHAAGVGARLTTAVGNRINAARGSPVPVEAAVKHIFDGRFTYDGGFLGGVTASMGPSAVIACGAIHILVATYASYEWGYEPYRAAGLDATKARLVSVKNPMNYRLNYPFAAATFILATDGPTTPDLRGLTWRRLRRPFWPKDDL